MEVIHEAEFETPIGIMRAASSHKGLLYLELPSATGRGLAGFLERFAPSSRRVDAYAPNRAAITQVLEYLDGKREAFELHLDLRATEFQSQVYELVAAIPYGATRSYGELAHELGRPTASRAVGTANGANPLPLVIPCHRVVGKTGHLTGYAGGVPLKRRLLAMESDRNRADRLL